MLRINIKPSPQSIQELAKVERLCGRLERLSGCQTPFAASEKVLDGALAAFALDHQTSGNLSLQLVKEIKEKDLSDSYPIPNHPLLRAYLSAHTGEFEPEPAALRSLYQRIQVPDSFGAGSLEAGSLETGDILAYRNQQMAFLAPAKSHEERIVFSTVSPYLVERRTEDLLAWLSAELERGVQHPLFLISTFHLLFLQTHPFPVGNHRLGLLLMWKLLLQSGYRFVGESAVASFFLDEEETYFACLRQAERSAYESWSTLNVWTEFFLERLRMAAQSLLEASESEVELRRLTPVQQRILEVIRGSGAATRDQVSKLTGININTVKYNLGVLTDRRHLQRGGAGRTTSYSVL